MCEREREKEGKREREREIEMEEGRERELCRNGTGHIRMQNIACRVCACVCVRELGREGEREGGERDI